MPKVRSSRSLRDLALVGRRPPNPPRGFTLVELMAIVAIIGILSVLAIYGVSRYLAGSKTAEATGNLGVIAKSASESLSREMFNGKYVPPGAVVKNSHCICASAGATVPASIATVKGKKYTSNPLTDWRQQGTLGAEDLIGWRCLKFSIDQPQYYLYNYTESANSCVTGTISGDDVHAIANGDLNGNGIASTFDLEGKVTAGQSQLIWAPNVLATLPEE
jgi:type IV pilus assembly protein PilA